MVHLWSQARVSDESQLAPQPDCKVLNEMTDGADRSSV